MSPESPYEPEVGHLPPDICEHFCTKSMYIARQEDQEPYEPAFEVGTAGFWCVHTQTAHGADGDEVSPDTCRPGRACCLPRLRL